MNAASTRYLVITRLHTRPQSSEKALARSEEEEGSVALCAPCEVGVGEGGDAKGRKPGHDGLPRPQARCGPYMIRVSPGGNGMPTLLTTSAACITRFGTYVLYMLSRPRKSGVAPSINQLLFNSCSTSSSLTWPCL